MAVDHFGDQDLAGLIPQRSLARDLGLPFKARALTKLVAGMRYEALAYVSNLENHPNVVRELAGSRTVFGNSPEVLTRVRHWPTLRRVCAEEGLTMPETLFHGEEIKASRKHSWLCKPVLSGGGHGIKAWDGLALAQLSYLQARVEGVNASAVFAADGETSVVLGLCEQIIGDRRLGAGGFRHCGNIFPLAPELGGGEELFTAVQKMTDCLTRRFTLRGVCGVDFMVTTDPDGRPCPELLEVNPRPTSSAELIEEAGLLSIFETHIRAMNGVLPPKPDWRATGEYLAKGIVFASRSLVLPHEDVWLTPELRDLGYAGDMIAAGQPVCSLLTRGENRRAALKNLFTASSFLRKNICGRDLPCPAWNRRTGCRSDTRP
jgi:predicted ATP-grasp superfamily ATP-dependent carboligase